MDEADGRPGHVALQSGHLNALPDVPEVALSHSHPASKIAFIPSPAETKNLRFRSIPFTRLPRSFPARPRQESACPMASGKENPNENLPGK
jgi:hypothetical protein